MTAVPTSITREPAPPQRRIGGLDVVRGIAVLLVMLRHAFPDTFGGAGVVGVVVFFALSGYLITGSIDREVRRRGRLSLARFYRNRGLRLLPALLLVLAVWLVLTAVSDPLQDRALAPLTLLMAITYTMDFAGGLPVSTALSHLWTLAVEEQFYLVWPFVLLVGIRARRLGAVVLAAGCLAGLACAGTVLLHQDDPSVAYEQPGNWFVALVIGALAYVARDRISLRLAHRLETVLLGLAAVLLVAVCFLPDAKELAVTYLVVTPAVALSAVLVIRSALTWRAGSALLRPLLGLGTISYGVYLWNYLVVKMLQGTASELTDREALLTVPLTIAAAVVSWYLVERPALRWKTALDARAVSAAASSRHRGLGGAVAGPTT